MGIDGGNQPRQVAASATRFYAGEPVNNIGTFTAGAISVHTIVQLADAKPRVATDNFQGIAATDAPVNSSGTVVASAWSTPVYVTVPIPYITRIRARAKTTTGLVDTNANLLAILLNAVDFDLTSSTFTIDATAASNASGLQLVNGNIIKGTVDVVVEARAMRNAIS